MRVFVVNRREAGDGGARQQGGQRSDGGLRTGDDEAIGVAVGSGSKLQGVVGFGRRCQMLAAAAARASRWVDAG